jgi:hypothetical protein
MWAIVTSQYVYLDADWQKAWLAYILIAKEEDASLGFVPAPSDLPEEKMVRSLDMVFIPHQISEQGVRM